MAGKDPDKGSGENPCKKAKPCPKLNKKLKQLRKKIKQQVKKAEKARKYSDDASQKTLRQKFQKLDKSLKAIDTLKGVEFQLVRTMLSKGCRFSVDLMTDEEIRERNRSIKKSQRAWKALARSGATNSRLTDGTLEAPGEKEPDEFKEVTQTTIKPLYDMSTAERKKLKKVGGDECGCGDIKKIAIRKGFFGADPTGYSGPSPTVENITKGTDCEDIKSQQDLVDAASNCPPRIETLVHEMLEAANDADTMAAFHAALNLVGGMAGASGAGPSGTGMGPNPKDALK